MLIQWNPRRDLNKFERDLNALFAERANGGAAPPRRDEQVPPASWQPVVDVFEDAEKIQLVADLPGVQQEAIEITVENNVLTLKGERKADAARGEGWQRVERVSGPFARSFSLPRTVDAERH